MASSFKRRYPFADDERELKSNFNFTNSGFNGQSNAAGRNVKSKFQGQEQIGPVEQVELKTVKPQYYCSNDPFHPHCSTIISSTSKILMDIIARNAEEEKFDVRGLLRGFDDEETCERECTATMQKQFILPDVLQTAVRQFLPDDLQGDLSGSGEEKRIYRPLYQRFPQREEEGKEGKVSHSSLATMFPRVAAEFAGDEEKILDAARKPNMFVVYEMLAAHRGIGQINRLLILLEREIHSENVGKMIDLIIDRDYLNERLNETSKEIILRKFLIDVEKCSHFKPEICPSVAENAEKLIRLGIISYPTVFSNPHNWSPSQPDSLPFQTMADKGLKLLWQQRKLPVPEPFKGSDDSKWADRSYKLFDKAISTVCESELAASIGNRDDDGDYWWNKFADYYSLDPAFRRIHPGDFSILQSLKNSFYTLTPASTYEEQTAAFSECVNLRKQLLAEREELNDPEL